MLTLLLVVAACTPLDSTTVPLPSDTTVVIAVPTTIPRDCSRDVTAELNALVASAPDDATLQFPSQGCYQIDGTIDISEWTAAANALKQAQSQAGGSPRPGPAPAARPASQPRGGS